MESIQHKKMLVLNILKILYKYSDENHKLSQKDIIYYLKKDYGMIAERKAIKRNIDNLIEEGYDINYKEIKRGIGDKENIICSDFYIVREFDDSELRLLIDSLLFSKYIPYNQCKDLIKKLEGLSSKYFKSRTNYIRLLKNNKKENKDLFYNIDIIDEAISKNKMISFNYCSYNIDGSLVERKNDKGEIKLYKASPFNMIASNGRYYLVCIFENHENFANIRVDRIKNISIVDDFDNDDYIDYNDNLNIYSKIDLNKYIDEHPYMINGENHLIEFKFPKYLINDVYDWFGDNVTMIESEDNNEEVLAKTITNLSNMKIWAMQYGDHVTVLSPKELVEELKISINNMKEKYK